MIYTTRLVPSIEITLGVCKSYPWYIIIIMERSIIQCNLDYPDLVYPEPRLSGLARDLKIDYHTCAEGVTDDLLWVWL